MFRKSCVLIAALAASSAAVAQEPAQEVLQERWRCYGFSDYDRTKVLVTLNVYEPTPAMKAAEIPFQPAKIEVAGTEYKGFFYREGFDRRWDFADARDNIYAFVIEPDGTGRYYVFADGADSAKASDLYKCEQARR